MELVTVKDPLHAYLATIFANPKVSAQVTLIDGSTFEIKREVEGAIMIGLDYLLLDVREQRSWTASSRDDIASHRAA